MKKDLSLALGISKQGMEIFYLGSCLFDFYNINDYGIKNNDTLEVYYLNHGVAGGANKSLGGKSILWRVC